MYIEEFKLPVADLTNYCSTATFCKLSYYEPLTLSNNLYSYSNVSLSRYTQIKDIFVYYIVLRKQSDPTKTQLIVVINTPVGLSSLRSYEQEIGLGEIEDMIIEITSYIRLFDTDEIYCLGHSASGVYARLLASYIQATCLTIGELNLNTEADKELVPKNYVKYLSAKDLLCSHTKHTDNVVYIDNTPASSVLEGVFSHSIDYYFDRVNFFTTYQRGLLAEH